MFLGVWGLAWVILREKKPSWLLKDLLLLHLVCFGGGFFDSLAEADARGLDRFCSLQAFRLQGRNLWQDASFKKTRKSKAKPNATRPSGYERNVLLTHCSSVFPKELRTDSVARRSSFWVLKGWEEVLSEAKEVQLFLLILILESMVVCLFGGLCFLSFQ